MGLSEFSGHRFLRIQSGETDWIKYDEALSDSAQLAIEYRSGIHTATPKADAPDQAALHA